MAKYKKTTVDVLKTLPLIYGLITHKHIDYQGHDWLIRCRIKNLTTKPPLFIWDLSTNTYISGLIPVKETNEQITFRMDIITNGNRKYLYLIALKNGTMKIRESLENVA